MKIEFDVIYPGAMRHTVHALREEAKHLVEMGEVYGHRQMQRQGYVMFYYAAVIEAQWDGMDCLHARALCDHRDRTVPSSR